MSNDDIRWEQRFSNFKKALKKLSEVVEDNKHTFPDSLSQLEKEGLIQRFEYTFELAWKTFQDLLKSKGYNDITGPNPVIEQAFSDGYISDGEGWRKMKKARDQTSHIYDEQVADEIAAQIIENYYDLLRDAKERLEEEFKKSNPQTS